MKKIIISSIIYTFLGFIIGQTILEKVYQKKSITPDKYYFIGVKDVSKYYGITKDYEIAEVIASIYENNNVIILEKYIQNEELKNNIEQFDLLVKSSKDKEEIIKIEEVVLASYEEILNSY